jgi:hypothetical protein
VVVHDLDILNVTLGPSETDAPLIVDPNAHLSCPVPFQGFQSIAGRIAQVLDNCCSVKLAEFSKSPILNVSGKLAADPALPDSLGFLAFE